MHGSRICAVRWMRICACSSRAWTCRSAGAATTFGCTGAHAESAEDTLRELFDLTKNEEVTPERVHLALRERESGPACAGDPSQREHAVRVPRGGIRARGTSPARVSRAHPQRAI